MTRTSAATLTLGLTGALLLAGCTPNAPQEGDGALQVTSTDTECTVSSTEVPAGNLRFTVTNDGPQVTEFYLLAEDGLRIVSEVENIGPGLSRDLVVSAPEGSYFTACKPGMVGEGIRSAFTVTHNDDAPTVSADEQQLREQAITEYTAYVKDQTEQLKTGTEEFAAAVTAGEDQRARELYAPVRVHWERIEPVAESFGDLDPKLDAREADLEEGQEWTGWHRFEKDLWPPEPAENTEPGETYVALTAAERTELADQLVTDTNDLYERTRSLELTVDQISNGSKSLLDEVATGKVTGEEEIWSHTDLWDFQANVDGAKVAFETVRPIVAQKDPALEETLDARFTELQDLLDRHRQDEGFVAYTELTDEQVRQLADSVTALSEPLSELTAVVVA